MKKKFAILLKVLLSIACIYAVGQIIENQTRGKVLAIISSAQPNQSITKVINQFGPPSSQTDDIARMGYNGGAPRNEAFCYGKTLYQYYVTPPCTWVNIYTDKNGTIIYVNWSKS